MTYKQKKVLDFIKKFIKDNGYSPSYREIAAALKITTSTTHLHSTNAISKYIYIYVFIISR